MSLNNDPFAFHLQMLGPKKKKKSAKTRQFDVNRALQEFQAQPQLQPQPQPLQEFNPNHDPDTGQFTSSDGRSIDGSGGDSLSSPSSSVAAGNSVGQSSRKQQLIHTKLDAAVNVHGEPIKLDDEQRSAIQRALSTLPEKHLLNINRLIVHPSEHVPFDTLGEGERFGYYVQPQASDSGLQRINDLYGQDIRKMDLAIAVGRTPEEIHSTAVHEAAHVRWDSIKQSGTSEQRDAITHFKNEHYRYFNDPVNKEKKWKSFAQHFGNYGLPDPKRKGTDENEQEAFAEISRVYYTKGKEKYLLKVGRENSDLVRLNDSFRKILIVSNNG
jgi:hypothetical protein